MIFTIRNKQVNNALLFSTQLLAEALQALVRSLRERANPRQSPFGVQISLTGEPDIRVIMCLFCGDSYNVGNLIAPLFTLPACQQSGEKTISFLTFLGEKRRFVQVRLSSPLSMIFIALG